MSDEGGAMASEVSMKDTLFMGNAHNRQRGSGHSAISRGR